MVSKMAFAADAHVIALALGPEAVTQCIRAMTLMALVPLGLSFGLTPFDTYADAYGRGEGAWSLRAVAISLTVTVVICLIGGGTLILFGPALSEAWTSGTVVTPRSFLALLSLWILLYSFGNTLAILTNAAHGLRTQVLSGCALLAVLPLARYWGSANAGRDGFVIVVC
jgi:hypothetical protein